MAQKAWQGLRRRGSGLKKKAGRSSTLQTGSELAGFALVRGDHDEPGIDYSITEFFVLRKFRGRGMGERKAVVTRGAARRR
jgi:predicted acetyltransferase